MQLKSYETGVETIRDLIRERASLGDRPMVIIDGDVLSYAAAHERGNRIANALLRLGIRKGDVVASYMANSIDHICFWFGCAKIGAIWAPLNIALINVDLAHTIHSCTARMLAIDAELYGNIAAIEDQFMPDMIRIIRNGTQPGWSAFSTLLDADTAEPAAEIAWGDPAGIIFSGGSTGLPKGVLVANGWYFPGFFRYQEMFEPQPDDVHIGLGQLYHAIGSAVDVLCPAFHGLTSVMTRWFSASRFFDTVRQYNCTLSMIVGPAMLTMLAQPEKANDRDNPLRLAGSGTGGIPQEKIQAFKTRFGVDLLEVYGQTETGPLGCISQRLNDRPYPSQGRTNGWADIRIIDADGADCPPDRVGEILFRLPHPDTFMIGYYKRPAEFAEACRDLWFHSADLGRIDENGFVHFEGRKAHVIRRRGELIAAAEVEAVVMGHPAVARCAVVGVPGDLGDEDVKLCVQLTTASDAAPGEFVDYCQARLAYFKVPRYVQFYDALPLSSTKGEVERFKLKDAGIDAAWDREVAGHTLRRAANL